ncbi:hypothetical protein O1L60_45660 [Streptomyces diastatochromogenes]|nr:hypothetical protein [Streptomyces diastatochromogenes]
MGHRLGPATAARYAARRARYVDTDRLQLRAHGRAAVRLDFPYAAGRGPQRAEAARAVAVRFGVQARPLDRSGRALRITGPAEDVARYAAALPRVLDHAEGLTSWAARMYGECARRPQHADHFEALGTAGRRTAAAYFRARAFRRIVQVLTGPQPTAVPEVAPALPLWEQAETLAGVLGEYGWVEIRDAYDPAAAVQLLDAAEQIEAPAARWPVAAAHGEQLALFGPAAPAGPVVVIPAPDRSWHTRPRPETSTAGRCTPTPAAPPTPSPPTGAPSWCSAPCTASCRSTRSSSRTTTRGRTPAASPWRNCAPRPPSWDWPTPTSSCSPRASTPSAPPPSGPRPAPRWPISASASSADG